MATAHESTAFEKCSKIIEISEKILLDGYKLTLQEGERPDIATEWAVRLPRYQLSTRFGDSIFGRYRWYGHNPHPTALKPAKYLKAITPAFIEEWEKWSNLKSFLDLLHQWQVEWLIKQVGTPLGALQLVVDVADHLLIKEIIRPEERSPIAIALLTSAESHLKWPAHYLTLMHQERNHPLQELRSNAEQMWTESIVQRQYLQRCATTSYETQTTAIALRTELVRLLSIKISKNEAKQVQASDVLSLPTYPTSMKSSQKESLQPNNPLKDPTIKVTLTIRKRTPEDAMLELMAKPSKEKRHANDRGFWI